MFGALPEFDSMAVAGLLTELEERLGILIEDHEVDADMMETFGALLDLRPGQGAAVSAPASPSSAFESHDRRGMADADRPAEDAPAILFVPPLFEEMNRTRALIVAVMRRLAKRGHGCWLLDLGGTGESERDLAEVDLGRLAS